MAQDQITLYAPAKVNLYLGVHEEVDTRHYHRVDTVMSVIDVCDEVTVRPTPGCPLALESFPAVTEHEEENSCWRAAQAMAETYGREPEVFIRVLKRIPSRSGLGGASTDAAATILALAEIWGIDADDDQLAHVAAKVGADVPFFLYGPPALLAGAGDELLTMLPAVDDLRIALVNPSTEGISTVDAYAEFDRIPVEAADPKPLIDAMVAGDLKGVVDNLSNNLDEVAIRLMPELEDVRSWMSAHEGIQRVLVSGSGSCLFAVCDSTEHAEDMCTEAREKGWWAAHAPLISKRPRFAEE